MMGLLGFFFCSGGLLHRFGASMHAVAIAGPSRICVRSRGWERISHGRMSMPIRFDAGDAVSCEAGGMAHGASGGVREVRGPGHVDAEGRGV